MERSAQIKLNLETFQKPLKTALFIIKVIHKASACEKKNQHGLLENTKVFSLSHLSPLRVHYFEAYTSQILSLIMFALVLSDDRISMQQRRKDIVAALNELPGIKSSIMIILMIISIFKIIQII